MWSEINPTRPKGFTKLLMTIFEETVPAQVMNYDPDKDYLSELVGEEKKYKDQQSLAFSKLKADEHIQKLETEMSELRRDLKARTTLEELTDKWAQMRQSDTPIDDDNQDRRKDLDEQLTSQKIENIFNSKLTEYEKTKKLQDNADLVKNELKKSLGENYTSKVEDELNRLGMSKEEANKLAMEQPRAFLKMLTPSRDDRSSFQAPPKSAINTPFSPKNQERTMSYYNSLRDKDSSLYWSPQVQAQLHDDAIRLGERFFDTQ